MHPIYALIAAFGVLAGIICIRWNNFLYGLVIGVASIAVAVVTSAQVDGASWPFFGLALYTREFDSDYTAIRFAQVFGFLGGGIAAAYIGHALYRFCQQLAYLKDQLLARIGARLRFK